MGYVELSRSLNKTIDDASVSKWMERMNAKCQATAAMQRLETQSVCVLRHNVVVMGETEDGHDKFVMLVCCAGRLNDAMVSRWDANVMDPMGEGLLVMKRRGWWQR